MQMTARKATAADAAVLADLPELRDRGIGAALLEFEHHQHWLAWRPA